MSIFWVREALAGIEALGVYQPRYRITAEEIRKATGHFGGRGIQQKVVAGFDEDTATMAVEAAQRTLDLLPDQPRIESVIYASSGGSPQSHVLVEALGLPDVHAVDFLGDGTAGLKALWSAARSRESVLLAVAEEPRLPPSDPEESAAGASAVACLVTPDGPLKILASKSAGRSLPPDRAVHRAAGPLVAEHAPLWAAVGEPDPQFPARAVGSLVKKEGLVSLVGQTGRTASCSPFLSFAELLPRMHEGDAVLLAAAGQGASAVVLSLEGSVKSTRPPSDLIKEGPAPLTYAQYLRHRRVEGFERGNLPSQGAYVSPSSYEATLPARYRLTSQRCEACQAVVFPPRSLCPRCGGSSFQETRLSRIAEVYAYTVIGRGAAPTEFADQQEALGEYAVAIVQFPEGPRCTFQLTDIGPNALKIGMPVTAAFRRVYTQEGVTRYGMKFRPA